MQEKIEKFYFFVNNVDSKPELNVQKNFFFYSLSIFQRGCSKMAFLEKYFRRRAFSRFWWPSSRRPATRCPGLKRLNKEQDYDTQCFFQLSLERQFFLRWQPVGCFLPSCSHLVRTPTLPQRSRLSSCTTGCHSRTNRCASESWKKTFRVII